MSCCARQRDGPAHANSEATRTLAGRATGRSAWPSPAPKAGKSGLFNALAGRPAAIVSPVPGTTRDYLTRTVTLHGTNVELIDTAGWQAARDAIEEQAQRLGRGQAERADLVVECVEAAAWPARSASGSTRGPGDESRNARAIFDSRSESATLVVLTKIDLVAVETEHPTSVKTGQGIVALRQLLSDKAKAARAPALAPSLSRCRHHVEKALTHLRAAHHVVLFDEPAELMALELRLALEQIGEMVGAIYTDDLLDRIFSRFCIGK